MNEELLGLLGLIGIGAGGTAATSAAYDRLQSIGEEAVLGTQVGDQFIPGAAQLAAESLGLSQFRPFTVTTATGGQFGVTPQVDPETGVVTGLGTTMGLSPAEQQLQQRLMSQAQAGLAGGVPGAMASETGGLALMGEGRRAMERPIFGAPMQETAAQQAFGLGSQFMGQAGMMPADVQALRQQYGQLAGQAAGDVLTPTAQREADVFERIRATQRPEEERQRLALEERLAQQGRLGVRTSMFGGTPEQLAMDQAQTEARNRASLMAMQQAQAERQQALGTAQTLGSMFGQQAQLGGALQAQQAGLGAQYAGLGSGLAAQRQAMDAARQAQALQALTGGQGLLAGGTGLQQAQQQLALGALTGASMPQAQLLNAMQAQQLYPQLQQQAQLFGTGQYGETMMSGLEARLIAEQARANLIGGLGSGLLGGLFSPIATQGGGVGSLFTGILDMFGGGDEDNSGGSGGGAIPPSA